MTAYADDSVSYLSRDMVTGSLSYGAMELTLTVLFLLLPLQTINSYMLHLRIPINWFSRNQTNGSLNFLGNLKESSLNYPNLKWPRNIKIHDKEVYAFITSKNDDSIIRFLETQFLVIYSLELPMNLIILFQHPIQDP